MKLLNDRVPPQTVRANKLQALVLDWAGTTVDFGSLAPARTLQRLFAAAEITLTEAETRRDMGLPKKEHIRRILAMPRVSEAWERVRGQRPTVTDVDELYERFVPLQVARLVEYSRVIPGVADGVRRWRERGLKIGSTTGYARAMLDMLLESSAKEGYRPDCAVSPEDVGDGRPAPFMMFENAARLKVYPMAAMAKIGDTAADIEEGLNAGSWAIGVAGTGNGIGLSQEEFSALPEMERQERLRAARGELERAGAHYVIDTLGELDVVLEDIEAGLKSD